MLSAMMKIKPFIKPLLFTALLTLFDFLLRKGFVAHFIPFALPTNLNILLLFTVFACFSWLATKWFAKSDQISLKDLGVSLSAKNKLDFSFSFAIGIILWGIVALSQSFFAGFSWVLRPDFNPLSLLHGLLFIFIADLGTELYTRAYPLTKLEKDFGAKVAVATMVVFELFKSMAYNVGGDLFFYALIIPILHIVFFSFIYLKTKRLGASLGIHTGANFITISIFDLRIEQPNQAIPAGLFQASTELETLSIHALQLPWVIMAAMFSIATYIWWAKTHS
jgi:membrane protease YdiL (CAAX protease family)